MRNIAFVEDVREMTNGGKKTTSLSSNSSLARRGRHEREVNPNLSDEQDDRLTHGLNATVKDKKVDPSSSNQSSSDKKLSKSAQHLLNRLSFHAVYRGYCFASYRYLSSRVFEKPISIRHFQRLLKELVDNGLIIIKKVDKKKRHIFVQKSPIEMSRKCRENVAKMSRTIPGEIERANKNKNNIYKQEVVYIKPIYARAPSPKKIPPPKFKKDLTKESISIGMKSHLESIYGSEIAGRKIQNATNTIKRLADDEKYGSKFYQDGVDKLASHWCEEQARKNADRKALREQENKPKSIPTIESIRSLRMRQAKNNPFVLQYGVLSSSGFLISPEKIGRSNWDRLGYTGVSYDNPDFEDRFFSITNDLKNLSRSRSRI